MKLLIAGSVAALIVAGALRTAVGLVAGNDDQDEAAIRDATAEGAYRGSEPWSRVTLASFELRAMNRAIVESGDLRGQVVLLTFLDTQRTESCPVIASQIARTLDMLTSAERAQIVAVAISTDPAEDTKASVRMFLRRNRALGKLHYLGGGEPVNRLKPVWNRFMILSSQESGDDTLHSAPVRIHDRNGIWVGTLHAGAGLTAANLAHEIRVALRS